MKELKNEKLDAVSGGAKPMDTEEDSKLCLFKCKKCGNTWTDYVTNPEDYHGCRFCGWWFMEGNGNRDENGDLKFDNECLEYKIL